MKEYSVKPLQTDEQELKQIDDFSVLVRYGCYLVAQVTVNGPCLLDYLILKLRLPVVLYVSFAVDS